MRVLDGIVAEKEREVGRLLREPRRRSARTPLDVVATLRRPAGAPLRLIAEIKRKSPSAGALSYVLSPAERALAYAEAGASMISVLCDVPFFDGGWDHLMEARARLGAAGHVVPLLAKEFVLHDRQIDEARDRGADAVLIIVRIVPPGRLDGLVAHAFAEGIEPLVEITDEAELERACAAKARVIGVNARDLDSLAMDGDRAARVLSAIGPDRVAVHLSGVRDPSGVTRLAAGRADAALIGEALMRQDDPGPALRAMVAAARG
jgi:indole-3-glycerol phosphate synthase